MFSVLSDFRMEVVINFLPEETSTKHTGFTLGWISVFIIPEVLIILVLRSTPLALSGFEAWIRFVNHVQATFSSNYFAVSVTIFDRF
jgi:hypothetical protein